MSHEIPIKGKKYRVGEIPAMKQFHVLRRLAGVLGGLGDLAKLGPDMDPFAALEPLAEGVSKMSDQDAEYVINTCLAAVEMEQASGGWAKVVSKGRLMFENMGMMTMLRLTMEVLKHNLSDFFGDLPSASPGPSRT